MSKSYREKRDFIDNDREDNVKTKHINSNKHKRKEKQIHNALRSKNLTDLIKYSEDE